MRTFARLRSTLKSILKNLNRTFNKKHKGVIRDKNGMNFESYTERIVILKELVKERNKKQIVQKRLQVTNTEMKMTSINKVQFASLNNKRYYFLDGIVSLPYGHPLLSKIRQIKKPYQKIHAFIKQEKNNLLKLKNEAVAKHERLRILRSIYTQPIT